MQANESDDGWAEVEPSQPSSSTYDFAAREDKEPLCAANLRWLLVGFVFLLGIGSGFMLCSLRPRSYYIPKLGDQKVICDLPAFEVSHVLCFQDEANVSSRVRASTCEVRECGEAGTVRQYLQEHDISQFDVTGSRLEGAVDNFLRHHLTYDLSAAGQSRVDDSGYATLQRQTEMGTLVYRRWAQRYQAPTQCDKTDVLVSELPSGSFWGSLIGAYAITAVDKAWRANATVCIHISVTLRPFVHTAAV